MKKSRINFYLVTLLVFSTVSNTGYSHSAEYISRITKEAEQRKVGAEKTLADIYYYGWGTSKDFRKALHWYYRAASKVGTMSDGDAYSQFALGRMYDRGEGTKRNYKEAIRWYEKAAKQGYAKAQFALGDIYIKEGMALKTIKERVFLKI